MPSGGHLEKNRENSWDSGLLVHRRANESCIHTHTTCTRWCACNMIQWDLCGLVSEASSNLGATQNNAGTNLRRRASHPRQCSPIDKMEELSTGCGKRKAKEEIEERDPTGIPKKMKEHLKSHIHTVGATTFQKQRIQSGVSTLYGYVDKETNWQVCIYANTQWTLPRRGEVDSTCRGKRKERSLWLWMPAFRKIFLPHWLPFDQHKISQE